MRGKGDREDNKNLNRKVALDYHILSCLDLTAAKFILFMRPIHSMVCGILYYNNIGRAI